MSSINATVALLGLLGDSTRLRILRLLESEELSVAELVKITELPQPRISTHLRKLREAKFVVDRRQGNQTFYRLHEAMEDVAAALWSEIQGNIRDELCERDATRLQLLLEARAQSQAWPESVAGEMERHYSPGRTWEALTQGLAHLLRLGDVLDVGSGDGALAGLAARRARRWVCLDRSDALILAARRRLGESHNLDFVVGDMHELPFPDAQFDQVLNFHALTYAQNPALVFREAARVLRPGGQLLLVTLAAHDAMELTEGFGHVQPGFQPEALERYAKQAGLDVEVCSKSARELDPPFFEVLTVSACKTVEPLI